MKHKNILATFGALAASLLLLSGCYQSAPPQPAHAAQLLPLMGQRCTIQMNGTDESITGTVKQIGEDWLVMESTSGEIWVDRTKIVLIRAYGK